MGSQAPKVRSSDQGSSILIDFALWLVVAVASLRAAIALIVILGLAAFFDDSGHGPETVAFELLLRFGPILAVAVAVPVAQYLMRWPTLAAILWALLAICAFGPQGLVWRLTGGTLGLPFS